MPQEIWLIAASAVNNAPEDLFGLATASAVSVGAAALGLGWLGALAWRLGQAPRSAQSLREQAELQRLSDVVIAQIAHRVAERLAARDDASTGIAPDQTADQVRADLTAAIAALLQDRSAPATAACRAFLAGDARPAEEIFAARAARLQDAPSAAAEALHLQAALRSTRDPEAAEAPCREAVRRAPEDALGWRRLGHLYLRMGRLDDARAAFAEADRRHVA